MATSPTKPKQIAILVSGGTANDYAIIRNITQGWKKTVKMNSSGEVLYNPNDDEYTCSSNDSIEVLLIGRITGYGTGTIVSGGVDIAVTGTADTKSRMVIL